MLCNFLLVLNDIDHMKAWHTFFGCAGNLETFILCAARYWLSVFLKDTRNPKGPCECEFILFLFFFLLPYTALPKRSGLFVREDWVGVAFFLLTCDCCPWRGRWWIFRGSVPEMPRRFRSFVRLLAVAQTCLQNSEGASPWPSGHPCRSRFSWRGIWLPLAIA